MELIEFTKITIIVASLATVALAWSHWRELVAMFGIQTGIEPSEVVDEYADEVDEVEKLAERMAKSQRLRPATLFERVIGTGRAALGKNRLANKHEMSKSLRQAQRVVKRDGFIIKALLQRHPSSAEFNEITESFETFKRSVDKAKKVAS